MLLFSVSSKDLIPDISKVCVIAKVILHNGSFYRHVTFSDAALLVFTENTGALLFKQNRVLFSGTDLA